MEPLVAPDAVFMPRPFVQTTIPHRRLKRLDFRRRNGNLTLTMVGHPDHGLPYGKTPRLLLAWLTRQAKRSHSPIIQLPTSQAALIRDLGSSSTGGRNGSIATLHDQAIRLATATIHFDWKSDGSACWRPYHIASGMRLWQDKASGGRRRECWIELDPAFYAAIEDSTIPLDFHMLLALRSSLAIDLYAWLTYRIYRMRQSQQLVPWEALQAQFGADYSHPRYFQRAAIRHLQHIHQRWPELRVAPERGGLRLFKCRPHLRPGTLASCW